MEMLGEMNAGAASPASSSILSPAVEEIGPGGLRNMSHVSRKAAVSGRKKKKVVVAKQEQKKPVVPAPSVPPPTPPAPAPAPPLPPPQLASSSPAPAPAPPRAAAKTSPKVVDQRPSAPPRTRRLFAFGVVVVHVLCCIYLGGFWMLVLAAGSVALALATRFHDDDATLRRFRKALVNLESLERVRTAWNDHCPLLFKRLVVAVISWRLAGFLFGPRTAAAYLRTTLVVALSVSACLYLPLRDVQHRASDVGKIAGLALVASIFFVALDASAGPDASASLACAAWLARPSLEALDERLKTTSRAAALRTRDLGVVLLASSATEKNRRTLYVGFFGAWFVTSGSRDNDEEDDALGGLFKRL